MKPLMERLPAIAVRETRTVNVPPGHATLPAGDYAFVEYYCDDRKCDCRRVIVQVWRRDRGQEVFATLTFGWDKLGFYARKYGEAEARVLKLGALEPKLPQSGLAVPLLQLFREMVEKDEAYVKRLRKHYDLFRAP